MSTCLERLTRIQTTGLGDWTGRNTINRGEPAGLVAKKVRSSFHQSTQEEIPRAENTSADNTESHRELLRPSEWMDAKREAC